MKDKPGAFTILLLISFILLLSLFWAYFPSIILALLITSVFYPIHLRLTRILKGNINISALFMAGIILLILIIPIAWFFKTLSQEAFEFYNKTSNAVSIKYIEKRLKKNSTFIKRLERIKKLTGIELDVNAILKIAKSLGKKIGLFLYKQISSGASNIINLFIHFFLMILIIYALLKDGHRLKEYIIQLAPLSKEQLEKLEYKFQEMAKAIIIGNGISGIIQGIMGSIGFFMFGLGSPILWGSIIAFMAFLPIVGASIIFVPATFILMIQGKTKFAIMFFLYNLTYSSITEYFIKPKVIGQGMKMNSILVFIGVVGGIKLFGIMGIIYGPLIITIFLTMAEIYRSEYLIQIAHTKAMFERD